MTSEVRLLEYALGDLEPREARDVEVALSGSAELRAELAELRAALGVLAESGAATASVRAGRERLLADLQGWRRFLPFSSEFAELFDLDVTTAEDVLKATDRLADWTPVGVPGIRAFHFAGGPRLAGIDAGLVQFEKGAAFPRHRHHGRELTFILQGSFHFSTGERLGPGQSILLDGGVHHVFAAPDSEVIYATYHDGLTLEDQP